MNAAEFINKWKTSELTERSACQQHFLDLCELVEHPKPAEVDKTGDWFTFEKGADKHGGGKGWADVWKKGFFGWEYKKKHADLGRAYDQLLKYREALENPPLLVVCDMDLIEVHTNFTGTGTDVHRIPLAELGRPDNLDILRSVFLDAEKLKPGLTRETITAEAARHIGEIAQHLRDRGEDPHPVARFLDRIVFCMFAEDIGLLQEGIFTGLLEKRRGDPKRLTKLLSQLFDAMAEGGDFGMEEIRHFNGDLFNDATVLELEAEDIERLYQAAQLDWSAVDPSIFGTLFERGLDPAKRSQLGAHYTSREDIEALVEPVVMQPLRREWDEIRQTVRNLLTTGKKKPTGREKRAPGQATMRKARNEAGAMVNNFLLRLARVKVLDPACGSGNFLYVTLQKLKDLEKEVILHAGEQGLGAFIPFVGPWQVYGIEISPYAHELAQMTIWIGYLQWTRANGFGWPADPVLRPMHNFECKDAILDRSDPDNPKEPDWPEVDFIVGNPPFLGGKLLRRELGDSYIERLFGLWEGRVARESDLCCYWFEKARERLRTGKCKRAGLLATQGIRGGANRKVLRRIKETGDIFFAESDRPWILDGANVHVSMVGFDVGAETRRSLDGTEVCRINPDLSTTVDVTVAVRLPHNADLAFMGDTKGGPFEIPNSLALGFLQEPNPHGGPNSTVITPWVNGKDLTSRSRNMWIVDFGLGMAEVEASKYQLPFELVRERVKPQRDRSRSTVDCWWQHERARPEMRKAFAPLDRYVATCMVAKHRMFSWLPIICLPANVVIVFATSEDCFFGVLHSGAHEVWSRSQATQLREAESGTRYTPTTCFETFPFPRPTDEQKEAIAEAAKELDQLRSNWLNPPEWAKEAVLEFPGSADGPWARYVHDPDENGIGTVRYPRIAPKDEDCAKKLKKRTLTNLYNERPTWLDLIHRKLDEAVFAAYGWPPDMSDEEILEELLQLNLERAKEEASG